MRLTKTRSGTTEGRSSIVDDLIDRPGCSALPQIPGRRSESRAVRWSGTRASVSRGFLSKLGLTRSYVCVNAFAYALLPSHSMSAIPILSEPEQQPWRNELLSMIVGPALQAVVTFGLQARIAAELWSNAPPVVIKKVPHPSSRDATKLIIEWRSAVTDLRTVVTPDPDGDNSGPNYGARFSASDYAPIPRGDLPYGVPSWLGDDSRGRQSRPKRRNTVERDPADLMHTLIWRAPTG
jgi:hypothetical protein